MTENIKEQDKPWVEPWTTWSWNCPKCKNSNDAELDGDTFGDLVCEKCGADYEEGEYNMDL